MTESVEESAVLQLWSMAAGRLKGIVKLIAFTSESW